MKIQTKHEQELSTLAQSLVESQLHHNEEKLLYSIFSDDMIRREENKLLQMGWNINEIPSNQNEKIIQYINTQLK